MRRSRTGRVTAVVVVLGVGICAARMLGGPVGAPDEDAGGVPTTTPGTAAPLAVADAFAHAWLARDAEDWHAGLLPHASAPLAAELADVDPAERVPDVQITGEARPLAYSETMLEVSYPADDGTLYLRLVMPQGRWLVEEVTWRPDRSGGR